MYLPLGKYSPDIKIGLVGASRDCFPRALAEKRINSLQKELTKRSIDYFFPEGESQIIESRSHAREAADQMKQAGCDAAVLYLGNFSPEIEDATFVKEFSGKVMLAAAAEESSDDLIDGRGDALCGLLSAMLAMKNRDFISRIYLPENPVTLPPEIAEAITHFVKVMKVVKGISHATIALFGPRPRDFETCSYNIASLLSIGIEIEELGFFDLANKIEQINMDLVGEIVEDMKDQVRVIDDDEFLNRLGAYEKAILKFREDLRLSGMTSQCWSEQEYKLRHVPCFLHGRLASQGFPIACENDAYSTVAELMGQYATDESVTILDINHTIPDDFNIRIEGIDNRDIVGMFHCGNTDPGRLKNPEMKSQIIMKRLMEPEIAPDITRGTIEGQISASPITVCQIHGMRDRLHAYIIEGEFLDLDPKTFGCTGTAHLPGFRRFYRHVILGRFHHHAVVAFKHCGDVLFDAFKLLGVEKTYTPFPESIPYPGENVFVTGKAGK